MLRKIKREGYRARFGSRFGDVWRNLMTAWRKGKGDKP
jgi:hypothetical protein